MAKAEILDLKAAMSPSTTETLANLRSGDMLIVPQNNISKIERLIKLIQRRRIHSILSFFVVLASGATVEGEENARGGSSFLCALGLITGAETSRSGRNW